MTTQVQNILVGDRVRWESDEGVRLGEVINIQVRRNTNDELVPLLVIEYYADSHPYITDFYATDSYLKQVDFQVIFLLSNYEKQVMGL
jgi:hypothetical protein